MSLMEDLVREDLQFTIDILTPRKRSWLARLVGWMRDGFVDGYNWRW